MIRTRGVLYTVVLMALVLTVPWFFTRSSDPWMFGIPGWACYAVLASVAYAVLIAWVIGRYWDLSAGDDADGDDR